MKDMSKWLESLYDQLSTTGLTDKDKRPDNVPCETCEQELEYSWKGDGRFNYWQKPPCLLCSEKKRIETARAKKMKRLESAGVPPGFWQSSLENLHTVDSYNEEIAKRIMNWKSPSWLLAVGPVGTGKSTWITSLFNSVVSSGSQWAGSLWTTESSMFERADVAHEHGGYTARQASVAPYIRAPLLVLDDIGASRRKLTEWQGSTMRNLFDVRYSNGLPTFMTSNIVSSRDMTARYGGHIYSRILSASGSAVQLHGSDRRICG